MRPEAWHCLLYTSRCVYETGLSLPDGLKVVSVNAGKGRAVDKGEVLIEFDLSLIHIYLIYFRIVTVNMQFILTLVIIIFVFLLFHMLLDTYKRYFDEVVTGIDKLMEERAAISLSPELESVEHKLADVKRTLAERADKAKRAEQQKNDPVSYTHLDVYKRQEEISVKMDASVEDLTKLMNS